MKELVCIDSFMSPPCLGSLPRLISDKKLAKQLSWLFGDTCNSWPNQVCKFRMTRSSLLLSFTCSDIGQSYKLSLLAGVGRPNTSSVLKKPLERLQILRKVIGELPAKSFIQKKRSLFFGLHNLQYNYP